MAAPPPLPPRQLRAQSTSPAAPPQHQSHGLLTPSAIGIGYSTRLHASDPRTSSSQSLIAPAVEFDTRRSLLVVYIHGFYGNDQSFRSFPAHVHAFLTELLSETHIVHSKIYPRYKTYRAIQVARDNFSAWLEPHESPTTDVILVGHSMGGLLAAEVVLMPNRDPQLQQPFKHRILGTLSLDSPFLGLHPGIVVSGLSSLFQPAPKTDNDTVASASQSSLSVDRSRSDLQLPLSDVASIASTISSPPARQNELYDPPFFNDVPFREKPLLSRLRHFASKHKAEGILNAIGNHIVSHLEFGGCIADYPELSSRYKRIRALEDVDELKAISEGHPAAAHRRVRFVNYYTLSPGRPKLPPPVDGLTAANLSLSTLSLDKVDTENEKAGESEVEPDSRSGPGAEELPKADRAADNGGSDGGGLCKAEDLEPEADRYSVPKKTSMDNDAYDNYDSDNESHRSMLHLDPMPILDEEEEKQKNEEKKGKEEEEEMKEKEEEDEKEESVVEAHEIVIPPATEDQSDLDLAPIPPEPEEPTLPDLTKYTDKDARKQAEKEAKRQQKAYQQAVKDRSKAIREREKLIEKRRKKSAKEAQRLEKETAREMQELPRQRNAADAAAEHAAATPSATTAQDAPEATPRPAEAQQPKKLRKFCSLPSKIHGRCDPTWVDVYMADVDEVDAHCGLFAPGAHYDKLVGDVGSRVMAWVHDDMSTRAAMDM